MNNSLQTRSAAVALTLWAASAAACSPSFTPPELIDKLRVLALRNDPVNPNPGETTTFEALIYTPPSAAALDISYAWSWCPLLGDPNNGYACPLTQADLQDVADSMGLTDAPPLTLGTAATQDFENQFPTDALAELCQDGINGVPIDCQGGFPVRVNLTVTQGGTARLATTVLQLPTSAGAVSNVNPVFDPTGPALAAVLGGVEQAISEPATLTLPRLQETDLRAHVTDDQAESYVSIDNDGRPTLSRENLQLDWFVETGAVEFFQTGYLPESTDLTQFLENTWTPGSTADYARNQARLIVVLRDNRGGASWTEGAVNLEPFP